jgi:hypothetical protein
MEGAHEGNRIEKNARIFCLRDHYVTVSNPPLLTEKLKKDNQLSAEQKGLWLTDQMVNAAKILHVEQFILPMDKEGVCVPVICERNRYVEAYMEASNEYINDMMRTLTVKDEYANEMLKKSNDFKTEAAHMEELLTSVEQPEKDNFTKRENVATAAGAEGEATTTAVEGFDEEAYAEAVEKFEKETEERIERHHNAEGKHMETFRIWSEVSKEVQKYKQTILELNNDAEKRGNQQWNQCNSSSTREYISII